MRRTQRFVISWRCMRVVYCGGFGKAAADGRRGFGVPGAFGELFGEGVDHRGITREYGVSSLNECKTVSSYEISRFTFTRYQLVFDNDLKTNKR